MGWLIKKISSENIWNISEAGARASQLSDQATPNKWIESLHWFRYGHWDDMFQVAIFSVDVDSIRH